MFKRYLILFLEVLVSWFLSVATSSLAASDEVKNSSYSLEPLLIIKSNPQGFIPSSFWESMAWKRGSTREELFEDVDIKIAEEGFKKFCDKVTSRSQPDYLKSPLYYSIPPIIHFIWLGSPIPPKVNTVIKSWERNHPEWKIMIWTDIEVSDFSWSSPRLCTSFINSETFAEKADILRLEILYQFGGIYSDTDVVCFKSFHDLITNDLTFFAGLEMNYFDKTFKHPMYKPLYIGTAIMGAIKGSPVIKYCLDHYRTSQEAPTENLVMRAGPGLASRACHEAFSSLEKENILILPCSYLYPLPYENKWIPCEEILNFISSESLVVHLWDGSWLK